MCKKQKNGGTFTIVSATVVDVSKNDDVTRNNGNCDLCCKKILDGKEEAVQCEGVCSFWFHRYCAGISVTYFQRLSTTNAPFVRFTCYQHDQHVLTAQLKCEVVSFKVTGYRRGRGFKCGFYYPSLARYCQYGPESYSHV